MGLRPAKADEKRRRAPQALWSAAACCRFRQAGLPAVHLHPRSATGASKLARGKRQQAAALQSCAPTATSEVTIADDRNSPRFFEAAMRRRRRSVKLPLPVPSGHRRPHKPGSVPARTPKLGEQSQNVYENKGPAAGADIAFECLRCAAGAGRSHCLCPVPSGHRRPHKPGSAPARTPKLGEQSQNVYENKGSASTDQRQGW